MGELIDRTGCEAQSGDGSSYTGDECLVGAALELWRLGGGVSNRSRRLGEGLGLVSHDTHGAARHETRL